MSENGRSLVTSLSHSSQDNWRTPGWLLEILFPDGNYYDPCPLNPTPQTDGLAAIWPTDRPVFVNPPYSDPEPWLKKAAEHPGPVVCLALCLAAEMGGP